MHRQTKFTNFDTHIRKLADIVLTQVKQAKDSLVSGTVSAAEALTEGDRNIHQCWLDIEKTCIRILDRGSTNFNERRRIFIVVKVKYELVRIGILATRITQESHHLAPAEIPVSLQDISLLATVTAESCARAIDAFFTSLRNESMTIQAHTPALDDILVRVSARLEKNLGMQGLDIPVFLATREIIDSLIQINQHAADIANMAYHVRSVAPTQQHLSQGPITIIDDALATTVG
ncbi:MAG: PhoU domain-containing protein [bacterium]